MCCLFPPCFDTMHLRLLQGENVPKRDPKALAPQQNELVEIPAPPSAPGTPLVPGLDGLKPNGLRGLEVWMHLYVCIYV